MASQQEIIQASNIINSRGWGIKKSPGGWSIDDDAGRRIWPRRASVLIEDPWIGVIEADRQIGSIPENRGVHATRALKELERGTRLRPISVTAIDPTTGGNVTLRRWELLDDEDDQIVIDTFDSAESALEFHLKKRTDQTPGRAR